MREDTKFVTLRCHRSLSARVLPTACCAALPLPTRQDAWVDGWALGDRLASGGVGYLIACEGRVGRVGVVGSARLCGASHCPLIARSLPAHCPLHCPLIARS